MVQRRMGDLFVYFCSATIADQIEPFPTSTYTLGNLKEFYTHTMAHRQN